MTYKLMIDQKPTYLHAIVTGRNSRDNVAHYIEDLYRECNARNCFRVLIEERLEGHRLGTMDVFQIVSDASTTARGILKAIAYVDVNAENNSMHFAETVAVNRALPVTVFPTVADAERWLLNKDRGDTEPLAAPCADKSRP
jgi:hypothetical protein